MSVICECGKKCKTSQGLSAHRMRYCPLNQQVQPLPKLSQPAQPTEKPAQPVKEQLAQEEKPKEPDPAPQWYYQIKLDADTIWNLEKLRKINFGRNYEEIIKKLGNQGAIFYDLKDKQLETGGGIKMGEDSKENIVLQALLKEREKIDPMDYMMKYMMMQKMMSDNKSGGLDPAMMLMFMNQQKSSIDPITLLLMSQNKDKGIDPQLFLALTKKEDNTMPLMVEMMKMQHNDKGMGAEDLFRIWADRDKVVKEKDSEIQKERDLNLKQLLDMKLRDLENQIVGARGGDLSRLQEMRETIKIVKETAREVGGEKGAGALDYIESIGRNLGPALQSAIEASKDKKSAELQQFEAMQQVQQQQAQQSEQTEPIQDIPQPTPLKRRNRKIVPSTGVEGV